MSTPLDINTLVILVRRFLRDQPKFNKIHRIEETTDDEIKLCVNLALSDWNSTPPLLAPVDIAHFPAFDWLIVCTAMFILESCGVLQYRNDMPFNDNGVSVNPWARGPQYIGLAGMWSARLEQRKREFKTAYNYAKTFGIVRSPEFMLWDYAGIYQGPQFAEAGQGGMSAAPAFAVNNATTASAVTRSEPYLFAINNWVVNPLTNKYEINFYHNLNSDVDVRITNPTTGQDLRGLPSITFVTNNRLLLEVPLAPDGRFAGKMIAFKL